MSCFRLLLKQRSANTFGTTVYDEFGLSVRCPWSYDSVAAESFF